MPRITPTMTTWHIRLAWRVQRLAYLVRAALATAFFVVLVLVASRFHWID